jgi:NAD-dependent deacetylase
VITQNVDGLHQAAGSERVIEMHGDHQHLQCLSCGGLVQAADEHFQGDDIPRCEGCDRPLKPNVVLFGEDVRGMEEITGLLEPCDLIMVIGTSATVYPAAGLPRLVKQSGGLIYEFNREATGLTRGEGGGGIFSALMGLSGRPVETDYLFQGSASETLTRFADRLQV